MTALEKSKREIANFINSYVKSNGYETILSNGEIQRMLNNSGIEPYRMVLFSDMSYNRTNKENFDTFENDILCFLSVERGKYKLVGEHYAYSGKVFWKEKGKPEDVIVGEWFEGRLIKWNPKERVTESEIKRSIQKENAIIEEIVNNNDELQGFDKEAIVKTRVNQGEFRKRLLNRYSKCCLCQCNVKEPQLLIAGHIKPWAISSAEEKGDLYNGFLFCPNHDRLFDRGWITFTDNGEILISKHLSQNDRMYMNISENQKIDLCERNLPYLKYHRENVFINS